MLALRRAAAGAGISIRVSRGARLVAAFPVPLIRIVLAILCCGATGYAAPSTAELRISAAKQVISGDPKNLQAYNDLAAALCERAKDTGQPVFFAEADAAIQHSFQIAPGDYVARKIRTAVLLGLRRWREAWDSAKELNHLAPDDVAVWGLLAECNLALGNYAEAEKDAQWMFDLRPGNEAAFLPAAHVREVYGDLDGAIDFVTESLRRVPPDELGRRAFLMAESGRLHLLNGESKRAAGLLETALQLVHDSPHALKVAALVETGSAHFEQAASLMGRRYEQVKSTEALYDYAASVELAGRKQEAVTMFRTFEGRALAESAQPANANRELVFYYADRAHRPLEALRIAQQERKNRQDIATLDACAWALFRNGRFEEAAAEINRALSFGTRDPELLNHAKQIRKAASP